MATVVPIVWYANFGNGSSTGYFAVTAWHQPWTPTVGTITRQTAPTASAERCFICTTSGAVSGSEPAWSTANGTKTTDTSAVWFECTGSPALNADLTNTPLSSQNRSAAQALGNIITDNSQTHIFLCTTAGTTGSGEPSFVTTSLGNTTTDSGCTWTYIGTSFSAWSAPHSRLNNAYTARMTGATQETLYVSSAHTETATAYTLSPNNGAGGPPDQIICVADGGSFPPVAANITTGASLTISGTGVATFGGNVEHNGMTYNFTSTISPTLSATFMRFRNCSLKMVSANATRFNFAGTVQLINTTLTFGSNAGQAININAANFTWRDTPSALSASTWPTTLFLSSVSNAFLVEGVDLSAFAGTSLFLTTTATAYRAVFNKCKLASNTLVSAVQQDIGPVIDVVNCDTGSNTYLTQRVAYGMTQGMATNVVATSGASDGTTAYSWSLIGGTSAISLSQPFECIPILIWNTSTGSNVTVTIEAAYVGTALPYNDQLWVDCRYFGTAGSTFASVASSAPATILTTHTQWSASSKLWGGAAAARQNSHAYVAGDVIGVTSGGSVVRAFVCTTAGTSSGSLPGGYASAVDGSQITDGTAVFTAIVRFQLTLTLSAPQPQAAGYLSCYVNCGLSNSTSYPTFFVNPTVTLS